MDFESSSDEGKDEEITINQESQFPALNSNHMDYESSNDEGRGEEFPINRESST